METFIVTIRMPRRDDHDPLNKQTGECPVSGYCTDITGQHHSFVANDLSVEKIQQTAGEHGLHITRIERVRWLDEILP